MVSANIVAGDTFNDLTNNNTSTTDNEQQLLEQEDLEPQNEDPKKKIAGHSFERYLHTRQQLNANDEISLHGTRYKWIDALSTIVEACSVSIIKL